MLINTRLQEKKSKKTFTKSQLAAHYQVDRATFNKWVLIFCKNIFTNEKEYLKKRKFNLLEVNLITEIFGAVSKPFSKGDLVELAETDYKTIRESIDKFPNTYGISKTEYQHLSKFPPKIGRHILECLS